MQDNRDYHSQPRSISEDVYGFKCDSDMHRTRPACFQTDKPPLNLESPKVFGQDIQELRSALLLLQNDRDQIYREYMGSLSRWSSRESRMKRIIDKQRRVIHQMRSHIVRANDKDMILSSCQSPMSSSSSYSCRMGEDIHKSIPPGQSFIPPWDIDMDDIRRQLQDIDESICRVEEAKTGLSNRRTSYAASRSGETSKGVPRV